ncbi:MAG: hypothetical protein WC307_04990 [Candidatus Nanoarchaeia archaeon]|jgi:hypothetical protein
MSDKIIILEKVETINGFNVKWVAKNITVGENNTAFQFKDLDKIYYELKWFAGELYGKDKKWKVVDKDEKEVEKV